MGKLQIRDEIVDLVMNLEDYMKGAPDMKFMNILNCWDRFELFFYF